ncbi:MAG: hypothetical protein RLZZ244_178 [Verrucomicrobiota bacterium]
MNCRSRVIPGTLDDVSGGGILSKKRERAQFRGGTVRVARGGDWETIDSYVWGLGRAEQDVPKDASERQGNSGERNEHLGVRQRLARAGTHRVDGGLVAVDQDNLFGGGFGEVTEETFA